MSRATTSIRRLAALGLLAALATAVWLEWPPRHDPWAPLVFEDPPNWLTRHKLQRLDADGDACRRLLATTGFDFTPLPAREAPRGCEWRDAVRVRRTLLRVAEPLTLSCRAAVSLALWERHVVQPAAEREFDRPAQQLLHLGSLACRNVYGRAEGRRSQHASADAIDIAGVVLAGGRRVTVGRDWRVEDAEGDAAGAGDAAEPAEPARSADPALPVDSPHADRAGRAGQSPRPRIADRATAGRAASAIGRSDEAAAARFLRRLRDGACLYFDGVLGPAYNAAHADHLHLDRGPYRLCR